METVFLKILNLALSGTWMLLAVLLARLLLTRAPRRWVLLLWALAAARLALPFSLESRVSLVPTAKPVAVFASAEQQPVITAVEPFGPAEPRVDVITDQPAVQRTEIAASVWLGGAGVMLCYTLVSTIPLWRRVRESVPLSGRVRLCDRIDTPFLLGVFSPKIYLPANLPEADRAWVLAHETVHLRRGDAWWKALGFLILSVYWFHPLVWLSYALFCRDLEAACDEAVIRNLSIEGRQHYAETLLRCSAPGFPLAAPLAFGETGVKGRIRAIARYKKPTLVFTVLTIVLSLGLTGCFLTNPKAPEAFTPTQVQINDWLSSYYPSGALITDSEQTQSLYQMALDMEADGEKTPSGYSYGLVFRDADGEEMTFMISSNGVGCFSEIQKEQLVPDWLSGGEALYQAADTAVKNARVFTVPEVPETQAVADGVKAALTAQYPMYEQAVFRVVSHVLLAQTESSGNLRICVLYQFADYVREGRTLQPTQARREVAVLDMTPMPDGTLQCAAFYDAKALTEDSSLAEPFQDVIESAQGYYHTLAENCLIQAQAYARKQYGENVTVGWLQPQNG